MTWKQFAGYDSLEPVVARSLSAIVIGGQNAAPQRGRSEPILWRRKWLCYIRNLSPRYNWRLIGSLMRKSLEPSLSTRPS